MRALPVAGVRALRGAGRGVAACAAALLLGALFCAPPSVPARAQSAQPPSGSLSGRLTDLHSAPLPGVSLILRSQSSGAEWRATTGKNGVYRFTALAPGSYSLRAESPLLGRAELAGIQVSAGHEAHVQAAMELQPEPAAFSQRASPATSAALLPSLPSSPSGAAPAPAPLTAEAGLRPPATLPARAGASAALSVSAVPSVSAAPSTSAAPSARTAPSPNAALQPQSPAIEAAIAGPAAHMQPLLARAVILPAPLYLQPMAIPSLALSGALELQAALNLPLPAVPLPAMGALNAFAASPAQSAALETDPAAAAVTTTLSGEQLLSMPVSGRRWQDIFEDTPAATSGSDNAQLAVRAAGLDAADTTIDGASTRLAFGSAMEPEPGLPAQDATAQTQAMGAGSTGFSAGRGVAISSAAIREVRVVAGNVESEGAHAAGGRAGVETESGADPMHGQGFFFDRQNTWGARNPFTQWTQNTGTAAAPVFTSLPFTPPDHETAWGIGAGSRIRRDRLFWFAALDGYRRNDAGVATARHPLGADQYGDCVGFFCPPSNGEVQLLSAQLDETENQAGNDYMGVPRAGMAGAGLEQLAGLLGPAPRTAAQWVGFARLDWQAAERHRFTLEATGADWNAPGGGLTRLSESYGNHSFGSSQASQEWLLARWEAYLTPNVLAVTQASAGREILSARPDTPSGFEQNFLGSGWNPYGQLPQIAIDTSYGFTAGNPSRFGQGSYPDERMLHGQEMLDWVRGRLLIKAGFELDHNTDATTLLRNQTGTYTYSKVQNFIADALVFEKFGAAPSNYQNQHNCNPAHNGLGALPCYSYFSQEIGPDFWQLGTNDWAGYSSAQWQLKPSAVFSAGLRWELEQLPPPIKLVDNPGLPLTERLPALGNQWGPRLSLALGNGRRWPVLRLGYGMYFGRTENAALETALTQTGSLKGDLYYFIRPTDGYSSATNTSIAPPFPHVLTGSPGSVVVPGAVEYAPRFRNPEVHQAVAAVEQPLPSHFLLTASALLSLGRRLPVSMDANLAALTATQTITYNVCEETPPTPVNSTTSNGQCGNLGSGPIKAAQITVPFYALWPVGDCPTSTLLNVAGQCGWANPGYQQITEIESRANSTYEAAVVKLTRYGHRGLSLNAHYTYAHAMDWNPGEVPLDPALDPVTGFKEEYGTSNLDVRHSAAVMLVYEPAWKLEGAAGKLGNGWRLSGIGQYHSGLPYTMRVSGSLAQEFTSSGASIIALGPGMNGSGGDSRVFGLGSDNQVYNIGRNTYRYPQTWKADVRLGKNFRWGEQREIELLAESFNLFNHQNVTEIETTGYTIGSGAPGTLPTLNFLTGLKVSSTTGLSIPAFGQPLNINSTNFYRERQFQLGARLRF